MEITASMMTSAVATYLNPDFNPQTDSIDELSNVGCWLNAEEHGSTATCFIEMSSSADPEAVIEKADDRRGCVVVPKPFYDPRKSIAAKS